MFEQEHYQFLVAALLCHGHAGLFHFICRLDISFVLEEQLNHLFASKFAGEHQRCAAKAIVLLNLCAKFNQTAHARELVLLNSARQWRSTVLVVRIYSCASANQSKKHVQRAIFCCEMNRRLLLICTAFELHVRIHSVIEEK
jgi:hypothetical protein